MMILLSSTGPFLPKEEVPMLLLILGLFLAVCAFATLIVFVIVPDSESSEMATTLGVPVPNVYKFEEFPPVASVLRERAEMVFWDDIEVGFARYDDKYSVVYLGKPDQIDDLQQLPGIGSEFEAHLNQLGCFTFKQLANWSEETCRVMSVELGAHDQLYREDWLGQARELHLKKYGEKI